MSAIVKAYDIRGIVPDQLDDTVAEAAGAAFARFTAAEQIVVGRDMRPSGPALAAAFTTGATGQGADVVLAGLASTDLLYFASGRLDIPGAMFTASHNPARYNGIKLCLAGAAPVGRDSGLPEIRRLMERGVPPYDGKPGTVTERDLLADYAAHLRTLVGLSSIRRLTVVVDAGNGMSGHTVPSVFAGLPIDLVPMYFELDGSFPNHEANPIEPANMADLQDKVRATGADIGLAFDGDADRCFIVDERGELVPPSVLTALIATRELARDPVATIIHNLITSRAVPEIVREHSGHFYFRDFWRADSGMLAALHALAALGEQPKPLSELLAAYSRYVASGEINSTVSDQASVAQQVQARYADMAGVVVDHLDGLTVAGPDWWFNVRPSNTEPLMRVNVEAADEATMTRVRDDVLALLRS